MEDTPEARIADFRAMINTTLVHAIDIIRDYPLESDEHQCVVEQLINNRDHLDITLLPEPREIMQDIQTDNKVWWHNLTCSDGVKLLKVSDEGIQVPAWVAMMLPLDIKVIPFKDTPIVGELTDNYISLANIDVQTPLAVHGVDAILPFSIPYDQPEADRPDIDEDFDEEADMAMTTIDQALELLCGDDEKLKDEVLNLVRGDNKHKPYVTINDVNDALLADMANNPEDARTLREGKFRKPMVLSGEILDRQEYEHQVYRYLAESQGTKPTHVYVQQEELDEAYSMYTKGFPILIAHIVKGTMQ